MMRYHPNVVCALFWVLIQWLYKYIYYKLADNDSLSYLAAKFITVHVDKLYDLTQD